MPTSSWTALRREALRAETWRRHFRVDAPSIVLTVCERLVAQGTVDPGVPFRAMKAYGLSTAQDSELDR
jgi:pyruvate dehydrogenase complex dehydrogenase (E1) component